MNSFEIECFLWQNVPGTYLPVPLNACNVSGIDIVTELLMITSTNFEYDVCSLMLSQVSILQIYVIVSPISAINFTLICYYSLLSILTISCINTKLSTHAYAPGAIYAARNTIVVSCA